MPGKVLCIGIVCLMVYFEMGTMGRLVCVNVPCALESKLESLEKACFVLSLCSLSCRKFKTACRVVSIWSKCQDFYLATLSVFEGCVRNGEMEREKQGKKQRE